MHWRSIPCLAGGVVFSLIFPPPVLALQGLLNDSALTCHPDTLFAGDTLHLRLATPHGGHLAIIAPGYAYFYVVYWGTDAKPSLMPSDTFMTLDSLVIITDQTRGAGSAIRRTNKLIFTTPGAYRVLLGHNLATDNPQHPLYRCDVTYLGQRRDGMPSNTAADLPSR